MSFRMVEYLFKFYFFFFYFKEFSNKSKNLSLKAYHDKRLIKEKEVSENIARCLARLNRFPEAVQIADKFIHLVNLV